MQAHLRSVSFLSAAALLSLASLPAHAALIAYDDATSAVYNDGSISDGEDNLIGDGFLGWDRTPNTNGSQNGIFIGNSDVAVAGESWGFYANSGTTMAAVRPFDSALSVNQAFIVRMDNGQIQNGGVVGVGLRSGGTNVVEFYFRGGQTNYILNLGGVETTTSVPYTNGGLELIFRRNSLTNYTLFANRLSAPFTSTAINFNAGAVDNARLFNFNAGSGGPFDQYFNRVQIVPEPSSAGLLLAAGSMLLARRRA